MKSRSIPHRLAPWVLALAALGAFSTTALAGPAEDIQQADTALGAGDVFAAMALLRRAADQNHPLAQARLADLLHAAEFDTEALVLYRKSAEQGEAAGEFGLGRMYADAAGMPRDTAQALAWYRKAEKKNYPQALEALARAYRSGDLGLPKDVEQAGVLEAQARSARASVKAAAR
jgi:TPR repeat protein